MQANGRLICFRPRGTSNRAAAENRRSTSSSENAAVGHSGDLSRRPARHVLKMSGDGTRWHFGCRVAGQNKLLATNYYVGPSRNRCLFKALAHSIQTDFREGKSPLPIERTLLTTGIVAGAVESHFGGNRPYETPHLDFRYTPIDFTAMREMGASWKIITEAVEEPKGFDRLGKVVRRWPRRAAKAGSTRFARSNV